jgi:NodT family efflux transporter outer membrane factor (OMF) lipoprotein
VQALAHAVLRGVGRVRRIGRARPSAATALTATSLALVLSACALGPDYKPAAAPVPAKFKELKGWKLATPSDALDRGDWWNVYRDKRLDVLIKQVEISNQNVAAQAAAYEQARAIIREAQASLFPLLTGSYTFTRTRRGPGVSGGSGSGFTPGGGAGGGGIYSTSYTPSLNGAWDLDVWGKVRRQIESETSAAQASAAELANIKLSQQAQLANANYNLRAADALHDLLARTVEDYKRTLDIVQNQYKAGYSVTSGDVATAQAQVETAQAQEINSGVLRAQYEHAIAVLIGRPPAELTVAHHPLAGMIPHIPVTIPSTLLERRPDIAQAERVMQEENALIGVAEAAFFPDISLSGVLQWIGKNPLPFSAANEVWSLGAAASQPIFDGGLHSAQLDAARAAYWQSVAVYRQTVLSAFQGVEDELAAIRLLTQQLAVQESAVKNARTAVDVYLNQFKAGTVAFTTVVTAEVALLGDEETALTIRQNLFVASVTLIENLGGSWDTTLLPTQKELQQSFSLLPQLPTQ